MANLNDEDDAKEIEEDAPNQSNLTDGPMLAAHRRVNNGHDLDLVLYFEPGAKFAAHASISC
jgi:hypothetical protein